MKSIFKFIRSYIDTHRLFRGLEINNCSFVILDTETTGLEASKGDKIISLAALKIRNSLIQENEFLDELINPERDIPWESVKIHHITDEHVRGKPTLPELQSKINLFLKKSILIGHNIEFDKKFIYQDAANSDLSRRMKKITSIDTIYLTAALYPDLENYDLSYLCEHFNIKTNDQIRHSALGDCWITARLFLHLLNKAKEKNITTASGLLKLCNQGARLHHLIRSAKKIH
ncbi:3'-5' exonuclease [Pelagibacteraceae bacterium]|nr:3'-5' exonuclease [Pelagibacteraceae bacterium]